MRIGANKQRPCKTLPVLQFANSGPATLFSLLYYVMQEKLLTKVE